MDEVRRRKFSIREMIPTMVTLLALFAGLWALRMALAGDYEAAIYCVVLSCLLDKVDGAIARKLKASSEFGAQMDSLADFFDFGVVPGFIVYLWVSQDYYRFPEVACAWFSVLLLATCMALRLARFNVSIARDDPENPLNRYFFKGVPAPMAASLVLFPLILSFSYPGLEISPSLLIANTILVAIAAGSTIPTPCFKKVEFKPLHEKISLLLKALLLIGLLTETWCSATIICIFYLASIVGSWFFYCRFRSSLGSRSSQRS
ncbi:MAG: CDP-alcohol phosphatidyltransferase family protein [Rickettsiales bacterium]|jgi:CDP-diacylglycerol--serine O-phosphatidyltransferase|nr:CDP-alcohol phosphatidyltransferase family protein [Rickettsiales bacterium]